MSNKIIENFAWLDLTERERLERIALEQTAPIDLIDTEERERVQRIALEQTTPIDLIDTEERERLKRIALELIATNDPTNVGEKERERVKRIALNKAADTDPMNTAFNAPRDQTINRAYHIDAIQQLQNFINIQLNESFTFIDYFLLFISIAFFIYFLYNNTNSHKDYI
jgi:hypothetical protein